MGEHNPRGARGRHVEDGGLSFADHPCATQRPTRNDVRLASGFAGKLTVAASRPPWITMGRVVCLGVSRTPMMLLWKDRLLRREACQKYPAPHHQSQSTTVRFKGSSCLAPSCQLEPTYSREETLYSRRGRVRQASTSLLPQRRLCTCSLLFLEGLTFQPPSGR